MKGIEAAKTFFKKKKEWFREPQQEQNGQGHGVISPRPDV
jgi:hypothetical protein